MRARAQKIRADSNSNPRERWMLLFVREGSPVKQFHAGRDVIRLISRVAEFRYVPMIGTVASARIMKT